MPAVEPDEARARERAHALELAAVLDEEHDVVVPARPLPDIARAWVERADEEVREQDLLEEFARCRANLREAAAQYFNSDQLRVTIE